MLYHQVSSFITCVKCLETTARLNGHWLTVVDNHVNDGAYTFFKAVETETRRILPHHLANTATSHDAVLEALKDSEDVQFYWTLVSADIHTSDAAIASIH